MTELLVTDHPHFYPLRALRYERDALETQMRAVWHAHRSEQASPDPQQWLLAAYAERLRRLARERRQVRAGMRKLAAQ